MRMRIPVLTLVALTLAAPVWAQGHGYTPADIENGGLLYQANCTACHGPDGDGVPSINLGSGKFRRGTTDDEIAKVILGGIPGTAMPPNSFSESQAGTIVAYLRSLATSPAGGPTIPGDARRGRTLFEGKGECVSCHSVAGIGGRTGPSLTEVGSSRRAGELQRALLDPSADIRSDRRQVRAATRQGGSDHHRASVESGHLHAPVDGIERTPAASRQGHVERDHHSQGVADAVVQGQARRAGTG